MAQLFWCSTILWLACATPTSNPTTSNSTTSNSTSNTPATANQSSSNPPSSNQPSEGIPPANGVVASQNSTHDQKEKPHQTATPLPPACEDWLNPKKIETICGVQNVTEKKSSIEQKNNCNRTFRIGTGWGAALYFMVTPLRSAEAGQTILEQKKKDYKNGKVLPITLTASPSISTNSAYTVTYPDPFTKRNMKEIVFVHRLWLIELKAEEAPAGAKQKAPCYSGEYLTEVAKSILHDIGK